MPIQDEWQTRLIGAHEAASRLGLSIWTVYAWARTGRIPSVRLGTRRLFHVRDLEQLVANGRALRDPDSPPRVFHAGG